MNVDISHQTDSSGKPTFDWLSTISSQCKLNHKGNYILDQSNLHTSSLRMKSLFSFVLNFWECTFTKLHLYLEREMTLWIEKQLLPKKVLHVLFNCTSSPVVKLSPREVTPRFIPPTFPTLQNWFKAVTPPFPTSAWQMLCAACQLLDTSIWQAAKSIWQAAWYLLDTCLVPAWQMLCVKQLTCSTKHLTSTWRKLWCMRMQVAIYRLCHKTAPMPIHLYVLIAFGMGLVVHRRVHQAHNILQNIIVRTNE